MARTRVLNDQELEELRLDVAKRAKRANRQLLNLEKRGLETPAYVTARRQLKKLGRNPEKPRFKEYAKNLSEKELKRELIYIEAHELRKTITVTGFRKSVEKTASVFNLRYNLNDTEMIPFLKALGEINFKMTQELLGLPSDVIAEYISEGIKNGVDVKTQLQSLVDDAATIIKDNDVFQALEDYIKEGKVWT